MSQSRTLCIGMEVPKDSMAVASVVQDHDTDVPSLDAIGTHQCDIDSAVSGNRVDSHTGANHPYRLRRTPTRTKKASGTP
jgi:hypothetical protein